ncbi:MAG: phosphatidate cytidylyltransferase [Actinomycetes bacterium]
MTANDHPRSGRNLPVATGVGLILAALVVGTLLTDRWAFVALASAAILLGVFEVHRALTGHGPRWVDIPMFAGTVAIIVAAYADGFRGLLIALAVTVWAVLASRLLPGPTGFDRDAASALLALVYLPLMAGVVMLMLAAPQGAHRVLVLVILTVGNDVGGYAIGSWLGRHRIAPTISPKKSWEGLAGSAIFNVILGAVFLPWLLNLQVWQGIVAGLILVVAGTVGDLVASAMKRDLGIKDFGHLLPGHGGITDRLDGLVFNAVPIWLLLNVFLRT